MVNDAIYRDKRDLPVQLDWYKCERDYIYRRAESKTVLVV